MFGHAVFGGLFKAELDKNNEKLENKYKKVMVDIRFHVNSQNINLKKLWSNLGYHEHKELDGQEFGVFLTSIVPSIDRHEVSYFFRKMDANKDGSVSLKEIESQFLKFNIPLTSKFEERIPFLLKKLVSFEEDTGEVSHDQGIDVELEKKVGNCFKKLELTLSRKNLSLYKVFAAYDGDKSGQLDLGEFSRVMKRLDPSFTEGEV